MQIKMANKQHTLWATLLLLIICIENANTVAKKLNASQAFDDTWNTATDLENELEQKRGKSFISSLSSGSGSSGTNGGASGIASGGAITGQWSGWSEWSTCSRTCDGGIMQQIRRCTNPNVCKGENVRYRICNMQPCPDQQDFRADQCAAYNDVPYDGTLYKWTPHYDYIEPCALTCRGQPAHLADDVSPEADGGGADDSAHYEEPSVIVQLAARVQDGTRCRSGSLDMCIQGKCQRVGCDLKIGSAKKIDACGVCGGDGNSCTQPLHHWETAPMSLCSVTCGGGYKMANSVCRNRLTGTEVDESLCSAANRPETLVELCNTHSCPPQWFADDWSSCSRLCGAGYRERMVVCAEENEGIKTRVSEMMCRTAKPPTQETCLVQECPTWEVEQWMPCSVTCGKGIQMRGVECKLSDGSLSAQCDPHSKPISAQQCATGMNCDGTMSGGGTIIIGSSGPMGVRRDSNSNSAASASDSSTAMEDDDLADREDRDDKDDEDVDVDADVDDDDEDGDDTTDMDDDDHDNDNSELQPDNLETEAYSDQAMPQPRYAHHSMQRLQHEEPDGPRTLPQHRMHMNNDNDDDGGAGNGNDPYAFDPERPSVEPTFIKDTEWSPCSVTCGEGIRRRMYKCKIFLEYSRTIATVNDTMCEGQRPPDEVERCVEEPCMLPSHGYEDQYPRDSIKVGVSEPGKTYVWREQGYTSCSASCLGGVEELIINCVREDNGRVVSPFLCSPETKPEARVRTCNDRPCPPRWNYSDYTPCSKSCGIGIKTREVQCIHEVTRGGENTMVVPNSMCPQPPPADRQYCNVLDCPVRWEVGEWSKCSHTCGYGIKDRKVECKQIMAQEHKIERPETMCPSVKPPDKKPCNVKPCPPEDPKPVISVSNTTHIQHDPKKVKVTLKVGGAGVVFFGTQVKIKCPVKRFNRTKIKWSKDHKPLARSRKFKVSKKGALRILDITFRDAGVYSCHAGLSSAEINIDVKAKPGQQAEELERQESERLVRERSGTEPLTSADMTSTSETGINGSSQSTRKKQANGRERNRRPKSDSVQHADSSIMEDEHSQLVQQQAQDGMPQSASASSGGTRHTNALLAMPYFQALLSNLQFLMPLQRFSNSRGQHMLLDKNWQLDNGIVSYDNDEPRHNHHQSDQIDGIEGLRRFDSDVMEPQVPYNIAIDEPLTTSTTTMRSIQPFRWHNGNATTATATNSNTNHYDNHNSNNNNIENDNDNSNSNNNNNRNKNENENNVVMHRQPTEEYVAYRWHTSEWSDCSEQCDYFGNGFRHRSVFCVRTATELELELEQQLVHANQKHNEMQIVKSTLCEQQSNMAMPQAVESCESRECPNWEAGEWTLCQQSRCHAHNTAMQRRVVSCKYGNGTTAIGCEKHERPLSRRECYNERCRGVWRVEPWSKCNAMCGRQGIKYRILQCVWYGTRRPAGNGCKHQPRPAVMKVCKSPPCRPKALTHCEDTSRYCRNVRSMGLCRLHRYQEKCCQSCQLH